MRLRDGRRFYTAGRYTPLYNSYFKILFEKTFQQMGRVAISGEDVVVVSSNFSPMASLSSI